MVRFRCQAAGRPWAAPPKVSTLPLASGRSHRVPVLRFLAGSVMLRCPRQRGILSEVVKPHRPVGAEGTHRLTEGCGDVESCEAPGGGLL